MDNKIFWHIFCIVSVLIAIPQWRFNTIIFLPQTIKEVTHGRCMRTDP
jgi:hypothetical protein